MGGSSCSKQIAEIAERVGELIAEKGGILLCGGGSGVMEACCKGAKSAGGLTIGIMPGSDRSESPPNEYIDVPIFTGMSDARNSINAKSSDVVIAIDGGSGTLSEIGLALKNGKPVIALDSWDLKRNGKIPDGYHTAKTAEEAVELAWKVMGIKKKEHHLSAKQWRMLDFLLVNPMKSANRLMSVLYSDDSFYESATYAHVKPEDAKKIFLYGVCKEVLKTSMELIQIEDFLRGDLSSDHEKIIIDKIIFSSINDNLALKLRKMIELLSLILLFHKNKSKEKEYRIYLNSENLEFFLSQQKDFNDFYSKEKISNTQFSINMYKKRIDDDLKDLNVSDLWFLKTNNLNKLRYPLLKTKKQLFKSALLAASDEEKLALGISYEKSYSSLSRSIHAIINSHNYRIEENNYKTVMKHYTHISLASMHIMNFAFKIAGLADPKGIESIMGSNFEKSDASNILDRYRKQYQVDDIVLTVWSDLVEIVDKSVSEYGYTAYKVKYISKPPLPDFNVDWLESRYVLIGLIKKSEIRTFYKSAGISENSNITEEDIQKILEAPDEELLDTAKTALLEFHKLGILIPLLKQSGFLKDIDDEEIR